MHNELKITDMQTLESNKNTSIENLSDENSIDLPDFTTEFLQGCLQQNKCNCY